MSRILTSLAVVFLVTSLTASAQEPDRDDKTAADVPAQRTPVATQPVIEAGAPRVARPAIKRPVVQAAPAVARLAQAPPVPRKTLVCRLKNSPAADVARSITDLLARQMQARQTNPPAPGSPQPVVQPDRQVGSPAERIARHPQREDPPRLATTKNVG